MEDWKHSLVERVERFFFRKALSAVNPSEKPLEKPAD
jgi:hypothetical protein